MKVDGDAASIEQKYFKHKQDIIATHLPTIGACLIANVVTSLDELSEHEGQWEALRRQCSGTIYSSYFIIKTWFEAFSPSASPRIILVKDKGELVGVAPLCSYRYVIKGIPFKVITLAGDMSGKLRLTTNSILCAPGRSDVLDRILKEIKALDWSILWTINMEKTSFSDLYIDRVRSTWSVLDCDINKGLEIPLPPAGDFSETYDSKARHTYRKIINRLEREGVEARLESVPAEGIDHAVDVYAQQHIQRWASKGGSYFRDPDNVRFLQRSISEGYARNVGFAYQLTIDNEVAAQVFGFLEGRRAYAKRIGMDDRFQRYSPGWLLCTRFLTELRDQGAAGCDMGWGSERYKYEMGGKEFQLVGIGATRGIASVAARLAFSSRIHGLGSPGGAMTGNGVGTESTSAQSLESGHRDLSSGTSPLP